VERLEPKSGEYYRVKIDAAKYNCYLEKSGFFPAVTGYTVINGDYYRINSFSKDNLYWMTIFAMLIAMIVCLILGSLLTVIFSRRILKPIHHLNNATAMVARGQFNVTVPEAKEKEYNTLIKNFNKMAQELSGIETLRGDFISNVSHEFKTPLASIQGFAKLLQDETISDEQRREYTQIIISETGRLSKLTSDILRLSKLENQNTIVNKSRFSIDEQIRKILLVLEPEWTKKNIELDLQLDDVFYFGNEELMAQIWQNVINNAIKFTPVNGHIGVRLFRTEKNITIRISDDGPAILPEVAEHIFDKFYQGDNSRKTEGNGLGLALVKRIVDLCGGKIYVENLYDGGVCFSIELPFVLTDMK
jgi:signal transduction histidine kinase